MKQPLMLTPVRIPPAQAEAMYDASFEENARLSPDDSGVWPGEDWDDDNQASYRPKPPPVTGRGRIAQH